MGGGSKSSTQVSEIKLPAWVDNASQENYQFAKDVANRPYQPYGGKTVADFSPLQNAAFDYGTSNIGAYQGVYDNAIGMAGNAGASRTPGIAGGYGYQDVYAPMTGANYSAQNVNAANTNANYNYQHINGPMIDMNYSFDRVDPAMTNTNYSGYAGNPITAERYNYNYSPETVRAQSFKDANVADYMNPYLDQVESYALQNLQSGTQMGLNTIGDQAARAGAFGGSRQGVQEGALMGDAAKRAGELSANVRAQGFDRAMQQITADQNRNLQGQMANQSAGMQNAGYGLQAGLANQATNLRAQEMNRDTGLALAKMAQTGDLANQAARMQSSLANQDAGLNMNRIIQATQLANQATALQAALGNQDAAMQLNKLDLDSQLANQRAGLEAAMANQNAGMQLNELDQASQFANQKALMEAQLANQQANLTNNELDFNVQATNQKAAANDLARQLEAALGMGQLGDQANASIGNDLARLLSLGGMQQEQEQRYLDDAYGRFVEARDYPLEQLNTRLAALGMSPYGRTQTTTSTQSGGGIDFGGILGGAGSFLGGFSKIAPLFMGSDKSMKTDIQKMGKDKETGLPVYSYRYKGDPKSYPKVVGLMADDVEKKMPNAVKEMGGKKAVAFNPSVPKSRIAKKKAKA